MRRFAGVVLGLLLVAAGVATASIASRSASAEPLPLGWGSNQFGQLASGGSPSWTADPASINAPTGIPNAIDVRAGAYHGLALTSDGDVWAWGYGQHGQVGDGTNGGWPCACRHRPIRVAGLPRIVGIAAGFGSSFAIAQDGRAWMWGAGQLVPTRVGGLPPVLAIAAGEGFQLALGYDGTVWSWGTNYSGELGRPTSEFDPTPGRVDVPHASRVAAGNAHGLVLTSSGRVYGFGSNSRGQLGLDALESSHPTPTRIDALHDVHDVAAGSNFSMALVREGHVTTWGAGPWGELGDGSIPSNPCRCRSTPQEISGLPQILGVAGGQSHAVALAVDGRIFAWGSNWAGELGLGSDSSDSISFSAQPVLTAATGGRVVAAGGGYTLVLALDEVAPEPSILAHEDQVVVPAPIGFGQLVGRVEDSYSGVARVEVFFDSDLFDHTSRATLHCDDAMQHHCWWYADLPDWPGRYAVHVRATDVAGNVGESFGRVIVASIPPAPPLPTRYPIPTWPTSPTLPSFPAIPTVEFPSPSPTPTEDETPSPSPSPTPSPVPSPTPSNSSPTPSPSPSP